jgi:hypothetical protein
MNLLLARLSVHQSAACLPIWPIRSQVGYLGDREVGGQPVDRSPAIRAGEIGR